MPMISKMTEQNLLYLVAGIICLFTTVKGLKTGSFSIFTTTEFKRSENPVPFWIAIIISGGAFLAAIFLLAVSFFGLKI